MPKPGASVNRCDADGALQGVTCFFFADKNLVQSLNVADDSLQRVGRTEVDRCAECVGRLCASAEGWEVAETDGSGITHDGADAKRIGAAEDSQRDLLVSILLHRFS